MTARPARPSGPGAVAGLILVLAAGSATGAMGLACEDEHRRTPRGRLVGGGGPCEAAPGQVPAPDCDDSMRSCSPMPGCAIDEARCGEKATCLPLADNTGKDVVDLRLRRLNIAAPPALAGPFIQNVVVNTNLDLAERSCAESGTGLFTWLVRVDKAARTIVTGGAPPSADPFGVGYCFADLDIGGTRVQAITAEIDLEGDTFRMRTGRDVNIPIFLTEELSTAVILPISDARMEGVTLSPDGNCIGSFNAAALDPSCVEDRELCPKWTTSGALGGFITLEQADKVTIRDLNDRSLCAFLASESGLVCPRDDRGHILYKGDFCSKDKSPGSCGDSVWLAATFAASAAKIFDGRGIVTGCSGAAAGQRP